MRGPHALVLVAPAPFSSASFLLLFYLLLLLLLLFMLLRILFSFMENFCIWNCVGFFSSLQSFFRTLTAFLLLLLPFGGYCSLAGLKWGCSWTCPDLFSFHFCNRIVRLFESTGLFICSISYFLYIFLHCFCLVWV